MIAEMRHHHPHVDPRQPRHGSAPRTNPPVFVWKPTAGQSSWGLVIARDPDLTQVVLRAESLNDPVFLPERALPPGRYFWSWTSGGDRARTFEFEISPDAVTVEVPSAEEWLRRLSSGHPRIYLRPEDLAELRASRTGARAEQWAVLQRTADALLAEEHAIAEPPFLPDRASDYQGFYRTWAPILWESRRFVKGAELLGLAYLASGDRRYARAACERMASIARWDPEGSSHLAHNDEAHMSVIWHGPKAVDWVWEEFTDEERALVIEQFRRRGAITFEHMHDRGAYGVTRFDSHAGREIVFLALLGMVFHEQIPEARRWLAWLRPVLCGIWPIWATDDGSWAEGPSYGLAYVEIMTMFATALKRGVGVDLYRRPFWQNHARWRRWCLPPYAEWMGFGDHSERWRGTWESSAALVERIDRETGAHEMGDYVGAFRREAATLEERDIRGAARLSAQDYLAEPKREGAAPATEEGVLRVFPGAGRAAVRSAIEDPDRDIALIFRSSPFGAVSHSHANHNDFVLHVAGKCLLMPSGYYAGYGSAHHVHWVWHTKSHNCVTLSDAGQIDRSHDSVGAVENAFEDEAVAYFRGTADAAYADRARRCRRHVAWLKRHSCFLMVDEFVGVPGIVSALQWNAHSWDEFAVDDAARSFRVERGGSTLVGHFLYHHNSFFSLSEGFDPPPAAGRDGRQWLNQHHLRFTPAGLVAARNLGVVLCPGHAGLSPAGVQTERVGNAEVARIGDDLLAVNMGGALDVEGISSDALAILRLGDRVYEVRDDGLARR